LLSLLGKKLFTPFGFPLLLGRVEVFDSRHGVKEWCPRRRKRRTDGAELDLVWFGFHVVILVSLSCASSWAMRARTSGVLGEYLSLSNRDSRQSRMLRRLPGRSGVAIMVSFMVSFVWLKNFGVFVGGSQPATSEISRTAGEQYAVGADDRAQVCEAAWPGATVIGLGLF
jgi:hypothetical protein